jgi:uncharacterized protein (UPF0248 family)
MSLYIWHVYFLSKINNKQIIKENLNLHLSITIKMNHFISLFKFRSKTSWTNVTSEEYPLTSSYLKDLKVVYIKNKVIVKCYPIHLVNKLHLIDENQIPINRIVSVSFSTITLIWEDTNRLMRRYQQVNEKIPTG